MNILILSAHTSNISDYSELTAKNNSEYALKHNYNYLNIVDNFDKSRSAHWSKIKFIKQHLPLYDYIFWLDSDVLIMRFDITLESFIRDNEMFDLIFNEEAWWDKHPPNNLLTGSNYNFNDALKFNTGVFFIKNSKFSLEFLDEVYKPKYCGMLYWDQGAMWKVMQKYNYSEIKILPNRTFQSIYTDWDKNLHSYKKGDFTCHFAGSVDKLELVKEYLCYVYK